MDDLEITRHCWAVTLYGTDEPMVTLFSDEDAAQKYYEYLSNYGKEAKVCIDYLPIYSVFKIGI